jgi:hypothetical protein
MKCRCNVCRWNRGEISTEKALKRELKYASKLKKLISSGKGDQWAYKANLDFAEMFIHDLKELINNKKVES